MTDLKELALAAIAVTSGNWTSGKDGFVEYATMEDGTPETGPVFHIAVELSDAKPEVAAYILAAQPSKVLALIRERDGHKADSVSRGKMLVRMRDLLVNARDGLDDQGDLVAFGSTNEADMFRDAVRELEDFKWSLILAEKDEPDLLERCRSANARAEAAEAALSAAQEEVGRLKVALADSIRRPMGGIPASAEGLITYADVAAAEERRAQALTKETPHAD